MNVFKLAARSSLGILCSIYEEGLRKNMKNLCIAT
jgi:hypothetical protein